MQELIKEIEELRQQLNEAMEELVKNHKCTVTADAIRSVTMYGWVPSIVVSVSKKFL